MNKLTKIALVTALFTSLVAKAEELAASPAEHQEAQVEAINPLDSTPDYQASAAEHEEQAQEDSILDEAVSSQEANQEKLPQS